MADRHLVAGMGKDIERYNARLRQKYEAIVQVCCMMEPAMEEELRRRGLTKWRPLNRKLALKEGMILELVTAADAFGTINFILINHEFCLDYDSSREISQMLQKNAMNVVSIHVVSAGEESAKFIQIYPHR